MTLFWNMEMKYLKNTKLLKVLTHQVVLFSEEVEEVIGQVIVTEQAKGGFTNLDIDC